MDAAACLLIQFREGEMKLHGGLAVLVSCVVPFVALEPPSAQGTPEKKAGGKAPPRQVTNSIGMKLALVPAGAFTMGSPATEAGRGHDETQHEVEITRPYYIGVFEVTQRQYHDVMGENPLYDDKKLRPKTADFPAVCVSWDDAMEFCKKLSERPAERKAGRRYRLPTEAEWEYACRGGPGAKQQPYSFGEKITAHQANFNGKFQFGENGPNRGRSTRVGSYPPNALGLYDMHGNVWEWCLDFHEEGYYRRSPRKDPQGPDRGFLYVLRGGSYINPGTATRSANRYRNWSSRYIDAGFRVVFVAR
jgi:formylglycine-generating enzyme required for sulfatase activity